MTYSDSHLYQHLIYVKIRGNYQELKYSSHNKISVKVVDTHFQRLRGITVIEIHTR